MKIEIGDKMFELEYSINGICDLEEITGKSLGDILSVEGFSSVRSLLWCGLADNTPGLTMKQAGALLQEYIKTNSLEEIANKIGEAVAQAGFLKAQETGRKQKAVRVVK